MQLEFFDGSSADQLWEPFIISRGPSEGQRIEFALERVEPLQAEHIDFRMRLSGSPSIGASLEDGLNALSVAEKMY